MWKGSRTRCASSSLREIANSCKYPNASSEGCCHGAKGLRTCLYLGRSTAVRISLVTTSRAFYHRLPDPFCHYPILSACEMPAREGLHNQMVGRQLGGIFGQRPRQRELGGSPSSRQGSATTRPVLIFSSKWKIKHVVSSLVGFHARTFWYSGTLFPSRNTLSNVLKYIL